MSMELRYYARRAEETFDAVNPTLLAVEALEKRVDLGMAFRYHIVVCVPQLAVSAGELLPTPTLTPTISSNKCAAKNTDPTT
jgi:hypothetical protein